MRGHVDLGPVLGVRVGLHYSWFFIATLIVLSLAEHFRSTQPAWPPALTWLTAVLTGALFFATLLLHELSHAVVARARGLPVRSITLFALGGVARIDREAQDPKTEFWVGAVGPLTSVAIGVLCLAAAALAGWTPGGAPRSPAQALLSWLGYINFSLALFNMVPGFPLDGGRVLRAALWWMTGDEVRATRLAARIGQAVALAFIVFGLGSFVWSTGVGGLWIALIGWFLLNAAGATRGQSEIKERLKGVTVGDLMARDCATVEGRLDLQDFVRDYLLRPGRRCFLVVEGGAVAGLVTSSDVAGVERSRWGQTSVEQVMRPLGRLEAVSPETPASESLEAMGREDLQQMPVVVDGRLQGIISRSSILQFLQTRAELNV